jgi:hypothetical protein
MSRAHDHPMCPTTPILSFAAFVYACHWHFNEPKKLITPWVSCNRGAPCISCLSCLPRIACVPCLCVQQQGMSMCPTKQKVFLLTKNKHLRVGQEYISLCRSTTRCSQLRAKFLPMFATSYQLRTNIAPTFCQPRTTFANFILTSFEHLARNYIYCFHYLSPKYSLVLYRKRGHGCNQ